MYSWHCDWSLFLTPILLSQCLHHLTMLWWIELMELGLRSFVHFTPMHHHHHTHTPPPTTTLFHHFSNNSLLFPACLTLLNTTSSSFMATHLQVSEGAPTEAFDPSPSLAIGQHDLLIVGPGILGRLVAHNWRQVRTYCFICIISFHFNWNII